MENINYNKLAFRDRITSVYDVTSNKNCILHKKLYTAAVDNYIKRFCLLHNITKEEFNKVFTVLEKPVNSITAPSSILQRNKLGDKRFELFYIVDLTPFWPSYKYANASSQVVDVNPEEKLAHDEVVYIDYVRGEATMFNRALDEYNQLPISKINRTTKFSEEMNIE